MGTNISNFKPIGLPDSIGDRSDASSLAAAAPAQKPPSSKPPNDLAKQLFEVIDRWSQRTGADVTALDAKQSVEKLYAHLLVGAVDDEAKMPALKAFVDQIRELGRPYGFTADLPKVNDLDAVVEAVRQTDTLNLRGLDPQKFLDKIGDPDSEFVTPADFQQFRGTPAENRLARALGEVAVDVGVLLRRDVMANLQIKASHDAVPA